LLKEPRPPVEALFHAVDKPPLAVSINTSDAADQSLAYSEGHFDSISHRLLQPRPHQARRRTDPNHFDEGTKEAQVYAILYESVRDSELSSHFWNFNTTNFAPLDRRPMHRPTPDGPTASSCPADHLRTVQAYDANDRNRAVPYLEENAAIFADEDSISLKYQRRVDENLFPPFFQTVLVARPRLRGRGADSSASRMSSRRSSANTSSRRRPRGRSITQKQRTRPNLRPGNIRLDQGAVRLGALMPEFVVPQNSFSQGELGPYMAERADSPLYHAAAQNDRELRRPAAWRPHAAGRPSSMSIR